MIKVLKSTCFILLIILIIASFLRLYNVKEIPPGFYPDEAIYANNGVEAWETGDFKIFYTENNGREGLWPNIIGFFIINFGHEPWISRSIAAIFGILTVWGIYFLTKELFQNRNISLFSTFLIATSFWHILFSRIGFRAIMAPAFLVWSIYFLLASLRNLEENKSLNFPTLRPGLRLYVGAIFSGISLGLGFHTYIAFRAMPAVVIIIWFLYWLKNKDSIIRKKIIFSAILLSISAVIIFSPLGIYFLKNPQDFFGRTTQVSIFNSESPLKYLELNIAKTAGMFNFAGDFNWRHNYSGQPELFWPVGILFLIGVILGIKSLLNKGSQLKAQNLILFSWIIIAALPVVISSEGIPHALRAILIAPPIFILAGIGGIWLYEFIKTRISTNSRITEKTRIGYKFILHTFCIMFIVLLIADAYITYFLMWGQNSNVYNAFSSDYVQLGRRLNDLPKELPKYVIVEAGGVAVPIKSPFYNGATMNIPMPAQTIMFITDTFTAEKQKEKNIYYITPNYPIEIPQNAYIFTLK